MLLQWKMNEAAWVNDVADVVDSSGNTNTGTSKNGASTVADAVFGRSGYFQRSGGNQHVELDVTGNELADLSEGTFLAWIKLDSYNESSQYSNLMFWIKGIYDGTNNYYSVDVTGTEHVVGIDNKLSGTRRYATGNAVIPLDTWTHVAISHNGTNPRLYINAVEDSLTWSSQAGKTVFLDNIEPTQLRVGKDAIPSDNVLDGKMDDLRVYSGALTSEQIEWIYEEGVKVLSSSSSSSSSS